MYITVLLKPLSTLSKQHIIISMGRAKLNMELISKEKSRNITFKKRKEGLMRKMHEFSTLCDVDACIIIYGPKTETGQIEPEMWPQDLDEIKRIIGLYKSKKKDPSTKSSGLSDFFHDRQKKIEQDLTKLKKKNIESKYPTWPDFLNFKPESELRALSAALTSKLERVKSRIDFLKKNKQVVHDDYFRSNQSHMYGAGPSFYAPPPPRVGGVEMDLVYQQAVSSMHGHQEFSHSVNSQNSMMMMMTTMMNNESDGVVQFEGASSTMFNRQIFYEPKGEAVDPLLCLNTRPVPVARYYTTPALPPLPPYLHVMPEMTALPFYFSNHEGNE